MQVEQGNRGVNLRLALIGPIGPVTSPGYKKSMFELHTRINRQRGLSSDLVTTFCECGFEEGGNCILPIDELCLDDYQLALVSGLWFPSLLSAARTLRNHDVPYLISAHGALSIANLRQSWYKKLPFLIFGGLTYLRKAEGVHFLNKEEQKNSWFAKQPVFISNTLSKADFTRTQDHIDRASNRVMFGFVGRYAVHHKGLDRLLKGFAKLLEERPDAPVGLILHGEGEDRNRVQRTIKRLGLADFVSVRGPVTGADKTAFFQQCDVFCHASRYEGQPQAVMEAMAAGCAILVTPGANMGEYVRGYECGVVSDDAPGAIGQAMLHLVNDRERIQSMGARARTAAEESFTPSRLDHELDALMPFITDAGDQSV